MVRKGEIVKRLDAYYHRLDFKKLREKYTNEGFYCVGKLINSWDRGDGPREGFYTEDSDNGVYFLRINNLKNNSIDLTGVKFINRAVHEKTLKRSKVTAGDLIFAISGTKDNLGTVSIVPDFILEANLNSALVRLNLDFSKIDKKYFCLLFSLAFVRTQIDYIGKGAAQNNLNNEEISQIQIPLPSLEKQNTIVSIFENAKDVKRQKETEAAQLLASIDGYLLEALGITLPPTSEKKTFFITNSRKISGGRFDPAYFDVTFSILRESIENGIYDLVPIRKVCSFLSSGKTPAKNEYAENKTEYPIVKVASYSGDTIDLNKTDYAISPQPCEIEKGDIFVLAAAHQASYVGRFVKLLEETPIIKTSFVGELICLRADDAVVKSGYLFALFSSQTFQTLLNCEKRGQTSHIYPNDIKHIKIPLPPLEKQTEIADHISALRLKAKQLQHEARVELERAKSDVERMILGEK